MADKYINAGIASVTDFIFRLNKGEILYTSKGNKVYMDNMHIPPFIFEEREGRRRVMPDYVFNCVRSLCIKNPYYELQKAHEDGKAIEVKRSNTEWYTIAFQPQWDLPVEEYRIKPEKTKLYLWAIRAPATNTWYITSNYYKNETELKRRLIVNRFIRLEHTMIEVDR